jgi:hypothetical protein
LYRVPRRDGITGTAANFALHVADLMDRHQPLRARARRQARATAGALPAFIPRLARTALSLSKGIPVK